MMTEGQLFKFRLGRNKAAREAALATIQAELCGWRVQIGGLVRGERRTFIFRRDAVDAVNAHYNTVMARHLKRRC